VTGVTAPLPITNGFYVSSSLPISAQQCVNWYPRTEEAPSLAPETLIGTPGITLMLTFGGIDYQCRGLHEMAGILYAVAGDTLFRINADFSFDDLGTVSGSGRVSIADNGTQLMVLVPGGNGYIFNKDTEVFAQITDGDFDANGNPQYVVFIDSYFCCTTDTRRFIISDPNDGTSWNAAQYGTAEADPDLPVAPVVFQNQLCIAGTQTLEFFQNIGGADFPFQRVGLFIPKGVYAPFSLVNSQSSFMFVGGGENEGPAIWMVAGNSPVRVSTVAIDIILQRLSDSELANIYAWTYSQDGQYFVGFALPESTLVYNQTNKKWHERKSYQDSAQGPYRVASVVQCYNRVICGDQRDGRIGELDPDVYFEYGNNIIRRVVTQPFQNNQDGLAIPSLELTVESGMGNSDAPNPVMVMERSDDGKTWYPPRERSLGRVGQYYRRAIWRRNGSASRFELFAFTLSDPIKPVIIQLTARIVGERK
jgi:hypothetical protein